MAEQLIGCNLVLEKVSMDEAVFTTAARHQALTPWSPRIVHMRFSAEGGDNPFYRVGSGTRFTLIVEKP